MERAQVAGALGALAVMSALVVHTSTAAFTATTDNTGNTWTAGQVSLTDDDGGVALFAADALVPGSTGTRCIRVTYNGDVSADVRMFATDITGGLADHLDLTVTRGSGTTADCADFTAATSDSAVYGTGLLSGLPGSFGASTATWSVTGAGQTASYRFTWTLRSDTPNDMQGESAGARFVWEAQSTAA